METSTQKYIKPKVTYTDQLTKEEIEDQLKEYIKVDNIKNVRLGANIKYFTLIKGQYKFRIGGKLRSIKGLPDYITLTNGRNAWSVQLKNAILYREMTLKEMELEYDSIIKERDKKYKELKTEYKSLANDYRELVEENDKLKSSLSKLNKNKLKYKLTK